LIPYPLQFFLSTILRPPPSTLFPYTTLFRSTRCVALQPRAGRARLSERTLGGRNTRFARSEMCEHATPHRESQEAPKDYASEARSEEHTSELQSQSNLVCRLLLEKKKKKNTN